MSRNWKSSTADSTLILLPGGELENDSKRQSERRVRWPEPIISVVALGDVMLDRAAEAICGFLDSDAAGMWVLAMTYLVAGALIGYAISRNLIGW